MNLIILATFSKEAFCLFSRPDRGGILEVERRDKAESGNFA